MSEFDSVPTTKVPPCVTSPQCVSHVTPDEKAPSVELLITSEDVCALLKVSPSMLYKLTMLNKIPHYKFSRRMVRFRLSEILAWIENKSTTADTHKGKPQPVVHKKALRKTGGVAPNDVDSLIERVKKEVLG